MTKEGDVRKGGAPRCGGGKGMKTATVSILLVSGIAALAGASWLGGFFKASAGPDPKAAGVVETAGEVRIPLASLDSGKALFLRTALEGKEVHFFALKSADGVYRAAFDACDVCFHANRGYRHEGDRMVCNQCGQAFPSEKVNEVKGGCNPAPLTRTVDGSHLTIRKSDLAAGQGYFPGKRS